MAAPKRLNVSHRAAHGPIISIRGLTTRFGRQVVHQDLAFDQQPGEIMGVIGASGSGKSVLLRTIIGLNRPAKGAVRVLDTDPYGASHAARAALERHWGVLFQDGALFSSLTVAQNVQVPLREHLKLPQALMNEIAALKISMAGLPPEVGPKYPAELSGGMRKRAALARALAMDPEVIFLDEPTAGLDPVSAAEFDQLIKDLQAVLGITVFMVTHDLDTLQAVCDRIAVLAEGRVYAVGTLAEVRSEDHPWIQAYFNGPRGRAAIPPGVASRPGSET